MKKTTIPLKVPQIPMTPELREFYRAQGAIGGRAAADKLTPAERTAKAMKAAAASVKARASVKPKHTTTKRKK